TKGSCIEYEASAYCSPKKSVSLVYFGVNSSPSFTLDSVPSGGSDTNYYAALLYGANQSWASACGQKLRSDEGMIFGVNQPKDKIRGGFQCPTDEAFVSWINGEIQGKGAVGTWCQTVETYCAR